MHTLFRLSGAFALGLAGIVGASAADLPVAPAFFRPPPPRVFIWTSCYLGGHVGYAFGDNELTGARFVAPTGDGLNSVFVADTLPTTLGSNGFLVGGQVGCNLQIARDWVIGVEADASWANVSGNDTQFFTGTFPNFVSLVPTTINSGGTLATKTDFIATLTGRLGYAVGSIGQGLIYGKGGIAWIANRHSFTGSVTSVVCLQSLLNPPPALPQCINSVTDVTPFDWTGRETRAGWTIGAGVEWAMWGNWTIKGEYDYLDFGTKTVTLNDQQLLSGPASVSLRQRISQVKFGINYRFGSPVEPSY
jgi:outer membrane immunogenic protein